ncbi:MAG: phosphopantothenoylcysteine decarboxylase [Phycisphaerales bacterium]|nr:phosphopantothenoylcysteine decarboxylase [Phycisphaerales bacterium]
MIKKKRKTPGPTDRIAKTGRTPATRRGSVATSPATRRGKAPGPPIRVVITAGPTHEPIDAVRFIGNRSSGRVGVALADAAAGLGWQTVLLLGPTAIQPSDPRVAVKRFRTTDDLRSLLSAETSFDVLIMAAAVADYRPIVDPKLLAASGNKLRRQSAGLTLKLEATPDLLAEVGTRKSPGQVLVGFALEPADRLESSAREKLGRKRLDLIVANELQTMDAATIEASVFDRQGGRTNTPGAISKERFAPWLLRLIGKSVAEARTTVPHDSPAR